MYFLVCTYQGERKREYVCLYVCFTMYACFEAKRQIQESERKQKDQEYEMC